MKRLMIFAGVATLLLTWNEATGQRQRQRLLRTVVVDCNFLISAVPYTASAPGNYCLRRNLSYSSTTGAAITIDADNVVLDLNDKRLDNLSSGTATQAVGILATDRKNITVRNGSIRGFLFGIALRDTGASSGHLIKNIQADLTRQIGILVQGSGNSILDSRVLDTGGSTNPDPTIGGIGLSVGIVTDGSGARVVNNDVATVTGNSMESGTAGIIQQSGFASPGMPTSSNAFFVNNRVSEVFYGVICGLDAAVARDNLFMGATNTLSTNCIDAGNNH